MKKIAILLLLVVVLAAFAGCTGDIKIADGTYRAEYADFDESGYKDFIEITFEDGQVTDIVVDAISGVDGSLKSESEEIRVTMQAAEGTYPAKYYNDLINQYKQNPNAAEIDIVAGATKSSNSFITLAKELEKAVKAGNTDVVIVTRK